MLPFCFLTWVLCPCFLCASVMDFFFFSASFVRKRKKLNLGSKWKTDLYRSSYIPWKFMRAMVFLYLSLLFPEPRNNIWTNKCLGLVNSRSGEIPIYGISTILVGCKYLQYLHRDCYKISVFNDIWPGIGILKRFYLLNINRYFFFLMLQNILKL